jgi:hypothetical protein
VESPLSRKIIAGKIGPGDTIMLKGTSDALLFEINGK